LHPSFSLSRRLVGRLVAITQISMWSPLDTRKHLPLGGVKALQLIGDDHSEDVPQSFEPFAEELLRYSLIASRLHKNIKNIPIIIHRPPQVVPFAVNREKDFIQRPCFPWLWAKPTELIAIRLPDLPANHWRMDS